MAKKDQLRTTGVLAALVGLGAAGLWWSNRQVPDIVRDERRARVFTSLRRDQIQRIEVDRGIEQFVCRKDGARWLVERSNRASEADDTEVERMLTEAEYAQPTRVLGALDAQQRHQFGLDAPRARVTLRESNGTVSTRFTIGADVRDERAVYAEYDGKGYVLARSVADAFLVRSRDLRSRNIVEVEVDRVTRIELRTTENGVESTRTTVLAKQSNVWRLEDGERVRRNAIDALLGDLRELRATRFVEDNADDAALARFGLDHPRASMTVTRSGRPSLVVRFGGACPDHSDEVVARRDDSRDIACVARTSFENASRTADDLRDNQLMFARGDEVERVVLHSASGEVTARRSADTWRLEGVRGDADADSVQQWLDALSTLRVETRLAESEAAARGLAPATMWIDVSRTGIEGRERIEIGARDSDHVYVRREGERAILALSTASETTLFVDAARFRAQSVIRDVPDELRALVTESSEFRDEVTRDAGRWALIHPSSGDADPVVMRTIAERIASLDAQRWVSLAPRPEHGLDRPRARLIARFEGEGPANADAGADGGPRVREYQIAIGAAIAGGGAYARLSDREGVFVLAQSALDELLQPHVDREVLSFDRDSVQRIECQQRGQPRFALRREASGWRVEGGASFDRARVEAMLETLSSVRAPRVFGYGPSAANIALGEAQIAFTLSAGDASSRIVRLTLGREFAGAPSGVYARVDDTDATMSVPEEVSRAIRACAP